MSQALTIFYLDQYQDGEEEGERESVTQREIERERLWSTAMSRMKTNVEKKRS